MATPEEPMLRVAKNEKKNVLVELPMASDRESSDPNFAYLTIQIQIAARKRIFILGSSLPPKHTIQRRMATILVANVPHGDRADAVAVIQRDFPRLAFRRDSASNAGASRCSNNQNRGQRRGDHDNPLQFLRSCKS